MSSKARIIADNHGMALLLVISVISLLVVVVLQFGRAMQLNLTDSTRSQQQILLESMARSGLEIGYAMLRADLTLSGHDTLLDNWSLVGSQPLPVTFGQGTVQLTITDLGGRFPVNRLVQLAQEGQNQGDPVTGMSPDDAREILFRLLMSGRFAIDGELQALEIIDSLVDWIDTNDEELPYGAETGYYQSLENPYTARNNFIEFVDELLMVKGMTREVLYGTDETEPLSGYITVHNTKTGTININTAPVPVFMSLDDRISEEDATNIDEFRTDEDSFDTLAATNWYQGVTGWPGDVVLPELTVATKSSTYLLVAQASFQDQDLKLSSIVERKSENKLEIVHFRMD